MVEICWAVTPSLPYNMRDLRAVLLVCLSILIPSQFWECAAEAVPLGAPVRGGPASF